MQKFGLVQGMLHDLCCEDGTKQFMYELIVAEKKSLL